MTSNNTIYQLFKQLTSGKPKKILGVLGGSLAAQALTVASYPVLTRLYAPTDFAIYGSFISIVSIMTAILGFRADRLMLVAPSSEERGRVLIAWAAMTVVTAPFLGLVVLLWPVAHRLDVALIAAAVAMAVASAFLNIQVADASRLLKTRAIAFSQAARALGTFLAQVGAVLVGFAAAGLTGGTIAGVVVAIYSLRIGATSPAKASLPNARTWLGAVRAEFAGMLLGSGQAGLNAFSNNLAVLVAVAALSPTQAGLYVLADRMTRLPISLVSNNIRNYLAVMGRDHDGRTNIKFTISASAVLAVVGLSVFGFLVLAGGSAFSLAFGDVWRSAGALAAILGLVVAANFAALPFQAAVMSERRYGEVLGLEVVVTGVRLVAFFVLRDQLNPYIIATIVAATSVFYYAGFPALFYRRR